MDESEVQGRPSLFNIEPRNRDAGTHFILTCRPQQILSSDGPFLISLLHTVVLGEETRLCLEIPFSTIDSSGSSGTPAK